MLNPLNPLHRRTALRFTTLIGAALVLVACGGGGSSAPPAGASASSFTAGPITGFGSVIVNGVRFDDSSASVSDDDGNSRSRDDLRLGMMAEIEAGSVASDDSGSRSTARAIRFGSEVVGPVSSVAADGTSLVVLGQTVQVTATTMLDDRMVGGLAGLVPGTSVVEVHGVLDVSTGIFRATRIEPKFNASLYKLRGVVSGIDKTAQTFRLGNSGETISYAAIAASVPASLDNGQLVRVRLQTTQVAGQWVATRLDGGARRMDDHDEAEIKGTITATTFDANKMFSVNGIAVDATNATYPKGTAGIVLGATVEVKGSAANGIIIATRVAPEDQNDRDRGEFELHGMISAHDPIGMSFALRGITVHYDGAAVEFRKGSAANLANGRNVEVKGLRAADGMTLAATRISFED